MCSGIWFPLVWKFFSEQVVKLLWVFRLFWLVVWLGDSPISCCGTSFEQSNGLCLLWGCFITHCVNEWTVKERGFINLSLEYRYCVWYYSKDEIKPNQILSVFLYLYGVNTVWFLCEILDFLCWTVAQPCFSDQVVSDVNTVVTQHHGF